MDGVEQRRHPGRRGRRSCGRRGEFGGVEGGEEQLVADEDGAVGPVEPGEADVTVQVVELGQQLGVGSTPVLETPATGCSGQLGGGEGQGGE